MLLKCYLHPFTALVSCMRYAILFSMDKKPIEIILAIGSIILFTLMLVVVHSTFGGSESATNYEGFGYVGVLIIFVFFVSAAGLKLVDMK